MGTTPHPDATRDPYAGARGEVDEMIHWAESLAHDLGHEAVEKLLVERTTEVARITLQEHLDQRFLRERMALRDVPTPGVESRARTRNLETTVGTVVVRRLALTPKRARPRPVGVDKRKRHARLRGAAHTVVMPADARLSMPTQRYSAPLREVAVRHVARTSIDGACELVDRSTGGHVPPRQLMQLVRCAAQDVEAFYEGRAAATTAWAPGERVLEVMSADGKGVRMRPEGLREETRKLAEAESQQAARGDPMAQRRARNHDRRMALVTANWEQVALARTPEDILRDLKSSPKGRPRRVPRPDTPRRSLPRPQNKRVRASLVYDQKARIAEMFAETARRDPTHARPWVVLVDGSESQLAQVRAKALELGVSVTIIVDVIHVLHYLWLLSGLLVDEATETRDGWVREHLMGLMTRQADHVVSGIRQSATLRGLTGDARKSVDAAVGYLAKASSCLDYGSYLSAGMPIATGVLEGACRYLVQDRMGITGARWGLEGGEAVLGVRAVELCGDWDNFWRFHLEREHERNYPAQIAA